MARPQKKGLDYFPLDVTCDKTDSDIEILEAKYKNGFLILIKLYMKIYQDEGYFIRWDEKQSLLLSKRVNVDFNEVNGVINDLVQWEVFNIRLFKDYKILTSKRIQETYIDAVKKRKSVDMIDSLMLTENINANINLVNSDIYPQSKVKKSKVNEIKENKIDFDIFWNLYDKKTSRDKCECKWNNLNLEDQNKILEYIPKYKISQPDKKFRKNPETFLNNKTWNDEIIGSAKIPQKSKIGQTMKACQDAYEIIKNTEIDLS